MGKSIVVTGASSGFGAMTVRDRVRREFYDRLGLSDLLRVSP
jgi:NAD(P)-dependent dehydrogenase (short-subunit alcohol dehydrogenase family)